MEAAKTSVGSLDLQQNFGIAVVLYLRF